MPLIDALTEIKKTIMEGSGDRQTLLNDVAERYDLDPYMLKTYIDNIIGWEKDYHRQRNMKRAHWTDCELSILFRYLNDEHGMISMNERFENMAVFLERGLPTVRNKYYTSKNKTVKQSSPTNLIHNDEDVFLNDLQSIIRNLETIEDIPVKFLFNSLAKLTEMASERNPKTFSQLRKEIQEKDKIIKEQSKQIESMQEDLRQLFNEYEKLKSIVTEFNSFDGTKKIAELNDFHKRLCYVVDRFSGLVVKAH